MKKVLILLFIITSILGQSPVNSVGSGCSLEFNGIDNKVVVNDSPSLKYLSSITLECWVAVYDFNASEEHHLINKCDWNGGIATPVPSGYRLIIGGAPDTYIPTGAVDFAVQGSNFHLSTAPIIKTGRAYHIAATYNGATGEAKIYINGILVASGNLDNNSLTPNDLPLFIGTAPDSPPPDYTRWALYGQIDEVRIWNYARTETEIRQYMCRKLSGTETGLVGYWRFDDCTGTTVLDASQENNNGTLN